MAAQDFKVQQATARGNSCAYSGDLATGATGAAYYWI